MLLSSDARWFWEQMFYWSKSSTDHKIVCELIGGRWWKKKYKSCNSKFHLVFLLFSCLLVKEHLEAMNIYVPNLTETFIPTDPRSQWIKQDKATERFHIQLWNWAFYLLKRHEEKVTVRNQSKVWSTPATFILVTISYHIVSLCSWIPVCLDYLLHDYILWFSIYLLLFILVSGRTQLPLTDCRKQKQQDVGMLM